MLTASQIKDRVKTIIQLPPLPSIAMEVTEMVENPRVSAAQIAKVISTDQSLTGKVLKIANSPFYGFPKKISTIDFAIVILGFDALKEIVVSLSLLSTVSGKATAGFDMKKFWDHSISTSVGSRRIARDQGYRVSGEAFVGGLLHEIGYLVLQMYFTPQYKEIMLTAARKGKTAYSIEPSVLDGVTHADIGSWLAERWNLPDQLVNSIRYHHNPSQAPGDKTLPMIIHLGDMFCEKLEIGRCPFDESLDIDPAAMSILDLGSPDLFQDYLSQYRQRFQEDYADTSSFLQA